MTNDFFSLSPDVVLSAIETHGYLTTGEMYQLNSYENRVFNIRLEPSLQQPMEQLIAKFYRPGRWTLQALREEHDFLFELKDADIEVIAPLHFPNGSSVATLPGPIHYSLFPKSLGRMPQEFLGNDLERVGRLLARLHNCGSQKDFQHRPTMGTPSHQGWQALAILEKWVSPELWRRYQNACEQILDTLDDLLPETSFLRLHGDCHRGNILSNDKNFFFVDFDDCINGPAVQDFWMLLPGTPEDSPADWKMFLHGYEQLRDFDDFELNLITPLRGLRIFSYAAWIASRWKDPSFPKLFPQFNSYLSWVEEVESLEKIAWSL